MSGTICIAYIYPLHSYKVSAISLLFIEEETAAQINKGNCSKVRLVVSGWVATGLSLVLDTSLCLYYTEFYLAALSLSVHLQKE